MSSIVYAIVFRVAMLEGFQPISVKAHIAKSLKADGDRRKMLFYGKQVVVKNTTDKAEAAKYTNALKKIGADIKVKGINLLSNEGNIVEPAPEPDTSSIHLAPNFDAYLVPSYKATLLLNLGTRGRAHT